MILDPKAQLLSDSVLSTDVRSLMRSEKLHRAIACAVAAYAMQNPGTERIAGANSFISVMLNIAEPTPPPQIVPDHSRDIHSITSSTKPKS
jgi:hypothetical protein